MIITKLILKGYKRFLLSNIDKLEYTPINSIQMIASRNLAGKSSLLKQLNPLPADIKKDFLEGGYKHIEIMHGDNKYILISNNKHSFICNGIELNPGGTKKVQLELVKEHFKLTPNILDIIYNTTRLTTMSTMERKYWFTEMSSLDYTYSITIYKKLKQRHRDILGGIKLLQESTIRNELNIVSKEQLDKYIKDKEHLSLYIDHLISLYEHKTYDIDKDYKEVLSNNVKILDGLLKIDNNPSNIEVIKSTILKNDEVIKSTILEISNIAKEIEEINKIKKLGNIGDLEKRLKEVKESIASIAKHKLVEDTDSFKNRYDAYNSIKRDLISNIEELDSYKEEIGITEDDIKKLMNLEVEINSKLRSNVKLLDLISKDIEHIEKHRDNPINNVTCEKCNYSWIIGFNPTDYDKFLKDRVVLKNNVDKYTKEHENITKKLDKVSKYKNILANIKFLVRSTPLLNNIWKWLFNKININQINVSEFIGYLNVINTSLSNLVLLDDLLEEEIILNKKINYIKQLEDTYKNIHKDKLDSLNNKLIEKTKLKNDLIRENEILNNDLIVKEKIKSKYDLVLDLINNDHKQYLNNVVEERNRCLQDLIKELKNISIEIEEKINNSKRFSDTLNRDKKNIEEYKKREKVLNLMCKVLSPEEGLIAKSINSFINVILDEMNTVINSIWTYPLELLPCSVDDTNDLDYKFKVKVNNDHVIEDVSKLSSSGQEIVDLAFRLVFTKYMGLVDIPLYLDEFGNTFDKAHRTAAYGVVDKIIRSEYKQIFIVSHYDSIYGSFKNIDFNVLDSNNIDLDPSIDINRTMMISR